MDPITVTENVDTVQLAADIVSAYVSNNPVRAADLPALITGVHTALAGLSMPAAAPVDASEKATPAQIRKSITPDALISFIDGKPYKTLKRHLSTHGLTFAVYRERYGLPDAYPTVSANYSAARSALARELGLGQTRSKAPSPAVAPTNTIATASSAPPKSPRRGRPRKAAEPAIAE